MISVLVLAMLIAGLAALVLGKFALTRNLVVEGTPARVAGLFMVLPLPLGILIIYLIALAMSAERPDLEAKDLQGPADVVGLVLSIACFAVALIITFKYGGSSRERRLADAEPPLEVLPATPARSAVPWIVSGVVAGVLLLVGVVAFAWWVATRPGKADQRVAQTSPASEANPGRAAPPVEAPRQEPRPAPKPSPRPNRKEEVKPPAGDDVAQALADLKSAEPWTRHAAADRLAKAAPDERRAEVARALEPLLGDGNTVVRESAARALGVWGDAESVPALIAALGQPSGLMSGAALEALVKLKDERGAEAVAKHLAKDKIRAGRALLEMGPVAENAVARLLTDDAWAVRLEACKLLKEIGTRESTAPLQAAAQDKNRLVANAAKEALQVIASR
jgi:hypothetical protein